jgi:hypothetical protein
MCLLLGMIWDGAVNKCHPDPTTVKAVGCHNVDLPGEDYGGGFWGGNAGLVTAASCPVGEFVQGVTFFQKEVSVTGFIGAPDEYTNWIRLSCCKLW